MVATITKTLCGTLLLCMATASADHVLGMGSWRNRSITDEDVATLVQALTSPNTTTSVCMKNVWDLTTQLTAGTNYRFQGQGCLLQGSDKSGPCDDRSCTYQNLEVTVFVQEWTNTYQVVSAKPLAQN